MLNLKMLVISLRILSVESLKNSVQILSHPEAFCLLSALRAFPKDYLIVHFVYSS